MESDVAKSRLQSPYNRRPHLSRSERTTKGARMIRWYLLLLLLCLLLQDRRTGSEETSAEAESTAVRVEAKPVLLKERITHER